LDRIDYRKERRPERRTGNGAAVRVRRNGVPALALLPGRGQRDRAIAVLEAAARLRSNVPSAMLSLPRLMLCQNLPFTPIYDAWQSRLRSLVGGRTEGFRDAINQVCADELTNWSPPYEIPGGVCDSLMKSRGNVLIANNLSLRLGMNMFRDLEELTSSPQAASRLPACAMRWAEGKSARIPSSC
jgi:cysteate synthase